MKEKYFLVNNFLPCICSCHKECLKKDLISRGYIIKSMVEITEKEYYRQLEKLAKKYKYIDFEYKLFY